MLLPSGSRTHQTSHKCGMPPVCKGLGDQNLSLTIPEPQEIIPFPKSLKLQFTAHFLLLYQESQENNKTHKLKQQKKLLHFWIEAQVVQKKIAISYLSKGVISRRQNIHQTHVFHIGHLI